MSFRDTPTMAPYLPAYLAAWRPRPKSALRVVPFLPTTTDRDWSFFDEPAKGRMTAKRLHPAKLLEIRRQAS